VHGFKKDNSNFSITIELSLSVDDYLIVRVVDNGVGLSQKKNNATSDKTSMGIDFIHKRLTRLSEFYKVTYSLDIHNVSGGNTGTEVTVILYAKFANENMMVSLN